MPKSKVKPGITIDKKVWEEFKENYPNASEMIETLMREANKNSDSQIETINYVNSMVFQDAQQWNVSYSANSLTVSKSSGEVTNNTDYSNVTWNSYIIKG